MGSQRVGHDLATKPPLAFKSKPKKNNIPQPQFTTLCNERLFFSICIIRNLVKPTDDYHRQHLPPQSPRDGGRGPELFISIGHLTLKDWLMMPMYGKNFRKKGECFVDTLSVTVLLIFKISTFA